MKKIYTISFVIAFIAIGIGIFYACKKEEVVKTAVTQEWKEKIEYMDITCVDFSRIKVNATKGDPMLRFDSWEHYASVIDAMLEFSYNYIDTRVNEVLQNNPDIDEDALSEIIHNEGIYQFMPLYSFCQQLQFDNNAFKTLRAEEIQRMQNPQLSESSPFEEMGLGYIQSALHNNNGDVMIGNEIFNPQNETSTSSSCVTGKQTQYFLNYN
jgi:hypothetical protein